MLRGLTEIAVEANVLHVKVTGRVQGASILTPLTHLYLVETTIGDANFTFHGGMNPYTGERTWITTNSIIAIKGKALASKSLFQVPPLDNRELFHRDRHICAYCGNEFATQRLTRDHVVPVSQGGNDIWMNVVTACRSCNQHKSGRTPEQAEMQLLYAPYVPNKAEYLILCNRQILHDQMDFLARHVPQHSRTKRRKVSTDQTR